MQGVSIDERDFDLKDLVKVVWAGRVTAVVISLAFLLLGAAYIVVADNVYSADALVQVENKKDGLGDIRDLGDMVGSSSGTSAEIQIIRSRSILGDVVDSSGLRLEVEAKRIPVLGALYKRPGVAGTRLWRKLFPSYCWGGCGELKLKFDSASEMSGPVSFYVTKSHGGYYEIKNSEDIIVARVKKNEGLEIEDPNNGQRFLATVQGGSVLTGVDYLVTVVPRLQAIQKLSRNLSVVELGRDTGILRLQMEGGDRAVLEDTLSEIANRYIRQNVERRSAEAKQSLEFLSSQLPIVRADLEVAENKLAQFRAENQTIDLSLETETVLERVVLIDRRLSELELKRSELMRIYTSDHPLVGTLIEQKGKLIEEKEQIEASSTELPDLQQDLLRHMREVEVATELYTYMLNKVQELRVVQAGTVGNVRIIDYATAHLNPIKPKKRLVLILSLILGAVVSVIILIILRVFRQGVSDPDVVEEAMGSPVYAVVPFGGNARESSGRGLVAHEQKETIVSEALRSLRTSVHFALSDTKGSSVVAITGPAPNVGKTFIAANLAYTFAESGSRVLFVDADMRRGDSRQLLQVSRSIGLSGLLAGGASQFKIVNSPTHERLDVIDRGKSPPNPSELIMSPRFGALVAEWRDKYDIVIIDTPPVLAVTDPVLIGKHADHVFFVGRAGVTQLHELVESKNRFLRGGVPIKGIVINGMTKKLAQDSRYGQGYGYYNYAYGTQDD